jgi:glycosyltransferase involved in cell wall biosynthesis
VIDSDAFGGAEVYTAHLLRKLPVEAQRSLIVSEPVAAQVLPAAGQCDAVEVVPLSRHARKAPAIAAGIRRLAPDVIQVNLVDPASNAAALAAALDYRPTVATLHLQGDPGSEPARLRSLYRRLAAAIAPSLAIREQLLQLGVPPERAVRIRNGVDVPTALATPRRRPSLRIGSVGRLTDQKGFDVLLAAVAGLQSRPVPVFDVVIAGAGREREQLERQAYGLPVRFLGACSDVPALLRTLDVFCLASRREAVSMALMEAMAHGLPCVATDVGDTREAVGGDAILVPPEQPQALADALETLLADPSLRFALGKRARARAQQDFTAERMAAETAAVLMAASGRPRIRQLRQESLGFPQHVIDGHVRGTREPDRAVQVGTRRTGHRRADDSMPRPPVRPPDGITGQEDRDAPPAHRGREVRGAGVVGDEQGGVPQQQRILAQRRPAGQIDSSGGCTPAHVACQRSLGREPSDDDA